MNQRLLRGLRISSACVKPRSKVFAFRLSPATIFRVRGIHVVKGLLTKQVQFMMAALVLLYGGTKANAGLYTTYDLTWSGAPFSDPARATGQVTLLTSAVVNGFTDFLPSPDVAAFSITVTGDPGPQGGVSNGTWGISYFGHMNLTVQIGEPLNPAAPLLGQPGLVDFNFSIGDASPFPPSGSAAPFTISTYNGSFMILTGMTSVPEPSSMSLLGIGVVGIIGYYWRQRTVALA